MIYAILILYFVITFLLGFYASRNKGKSPEDYFLAGRNLSLIKIFFTLAATNFSAFFFLGFAGEGYRIGLVYYAMMAMGTSFAAISFYLIGDKAWRLGKKNGYLTPVEMVKDLTANKTLGLIYMLVMLVFMIPYLAIQPIGAGIILEQLTDGVIGYRLGATILVLFIIVYIIMSGMNGIAQMDIKNGILMVIFMALALGFVLHAYGGLEKANGKVFEISPELYASTGLDGYFTPQKWLSFMLLWFCCIPMFPQIFARFLMSKDLNTFKKTTLLYTMIPVILFLFPVFLGILGHIEFNEFEGKEADNILPVMITAIAPKLIGALILIGALAAFMSTMDSILLAISTIVTRDIYLPLTGYQANLKSQVITGKLTIIGISIFSLIIVYLRPASMFTIATLTFTGSAMLFPATLALFRMRKIKPFYYSLSIVGGVLVSILFAMEIIPLTFSFGFLPVVPGLTIAFAMIIIGYFDPIKKPSF